ncbi:MAG: SseB family protein [Firmicutes bacterium]|nr:SseB family protein [Bacillota bacterium]
MKKEMLKEGIVLRQLIQDFKKDQNENTLFRVLKCLKDSSVYVPCLKSDGTKPIITTIEGVDYSLETFLKEGKEYIGIFTNVEQMKRMAPSVARMEVEFMELYKYIQKEKKDLVLDPLTNYLIIPASLIPYFDQL